MKVTKGREAVSTTSTINHTTPLPVKNAYTLLFEINVRSMYRVQPENGQNVMMNLIIY